VRTHKNYFNKTGLDQPGFGAAAESPAMVGTIWGVVHWKVAGDHRAHRSRRRRDAGGTILETGADLAHD